MCLFLHFGFFNTFFAKIEPYETFRTYPYRKDY